MLHDYCDMYVMQNYLVLQLIYTYFECVKSIVDLVKANYDYVSPWSRFTNCVTYIGQNHHEVSIY